LQSRVLIFDDDADLLEVCSIVLRNKNLFVIGKPDCTQIIADIGVYNPDVILMDNRIPEIGGIKATQLVKNNPDYKNIPVIFFSANHNLPELAKEAGADFFLQKPFEINDLEAIVVKAIRIKNIL
jgi:CheY-like chemotaxis protein